MGTRNRVRVAGRTRRRSLAWITGAMAAAVLAGCAIPFGGSDGDGGSGVSGVKASNSLYLKEQEMDARRRGQDQGWEFIMPNR